MDKFLEDISSTYWWIGVFLVGVVINIASSYIRKLLENSFSTFSTYWKKKKITRLENFNNKVKLLRENADLKAVYALSEIRLRLSSILFLFIGFGITFFNRLFIMPFIFHTILSVAAVISMLLGFYEFMSSFKVNELVEAATEKIKELE